MKNQVLRKAEKFTILISYFHELWKLKSLPPVPLITAGERNSFKICTQFLKQMVSQTKHYVIMDICHISQNVEK